MSTRPSSTLARGPSKREEGPTVDPPRADDHGTSGCVRKAPRETAYKSRLTSSRSPPSPPAHRLAPVQRTISNSAFISQSPPPSKPSTDIGTEAGIHRGVRIYRPCTHAVYRFRCDTCACRRTSTRVDHAVQMSTELRARQRTVAVIRVELTLKPRRMVTWLLDFGQVNLRVIPPS